MSPDIEWRVDDDSGKRVLATPTPPRWRRITLTLALVLVLIGFGLGIIYSTVGNPPASPTPTPHLAITRMPHPTQTPPPSLAEAVARDTRALAVHELMIAASKPQSLDTLKWYQALLDANSWIFQLDTIVASGTLPTGVTWVDLRDYRSTGLFHHIRFYRLIDGVWAWVPPDQTYWGSEQQSVSFDLSVAHFPVKIVFPVEDRAMIGETAARFIEVYGNLCNDVDCPRSSTIDLTLIIDPQVTRHSVFEHNHEITVTLSSPRVLGLFDSYSGNVADPIRSIAYDSLIEPLVCAASGLENCWSSSDDGRLFVQAIAAWQRQRVRTVYRPQEFFFVRQRDPLFTLPPASGVVSIERFYTNFLAETSLLPLLSLWSQPFSQTDESTLFIARTEVMATVAFIDQKYGMSALARFLHALGTADSLTQAIESGLGLSYAEFERQWQEWLSR